MKKAQSKKIFLSAKLSREQKKIVYIGASMFLLFCLFWSFLYLPQAKRFVDIKRKISSIEQEVAEILKISEGKELPDAVKDLKINFLEAAEKLPSDEEKVISNILESAKRLAIEVKNISPSEKRPLESNIEGYTVEELPISLNLSGEYKALGEYLDILRNRFPILIQVRQVKISATGEGNTVLNAYLQLCAYLARENK